MKSQAEYFTPKDEERIGQALKPFFMGLTWMYRKAPDGKVPVPVGEIGLMFRPSPDRAPQFGIAVRLPGKKFSFDHAKACLQYLGFDEDPAFEDALLEFYRSNIARAADARRRRGRSGRSESVRNLATWFNGMRGQQLKDILSVGPVASKRWEANLSRAGLTWGTLKIPPSVQAKVTAKLFNDRKGIAESVASLKVEFGKYFKDS
jgi:hypothetical protein